MFVITSFVDEDEVRMYYQENTIKESLNLLDSMKSDLPELLYKNTRNSFLEMIKTGTTTINDMYFMTDDIIKAALDTGVRLQTTRTLMSASGMV